MSTINVGKFNLMRVDRKVDFGFYMDDGGEGILLPKRFVPSGLQVGDTISVFVYHDSDNRLIATTQEPFAEVGDIAALKVVTVTSQTATAAGAVGLINPGTSTIVLRSAPGVDATPNFFSLGSGPLWITVSGSYFTL